MKGVVRYCTLLMLIIVGSPAQALGPFPTLYDDFDAASGLISPTKWDGFEAGSIGTETHREIQSNKLRLFYIGYGAVNSNSGRRASYAGLQMTKNAKTITGIEAQVQVSAFKAQDCAANPSDAMAFAGIVATFFNATTSGTFKDDVGGVIGIYRLSTDPAGVLKVLADIFRCTDDSCANITIVNNQVLTLGTTLVGQVETLRMKWDPANDQIIFQQNNDAETPIGYAGLSDSAQPTQPEKDLRVTNTVENCLAPDTRKKASMDALFDNVRVER